MAKNKKQTKYVVWATQGQGGVPVKSLGTLEKALKYVEKHKNEGCAFSIEYPNGKWHKWVLDSKAK